SSRFFEKKRRKKLLLCRCRASGTPMAQINNVFLLLFVHKKKRLLPAKNHSLGQLVLYVNEVNRG
ncbi:MAG: hypothetical protein POH28_14455, partial [Acidocella sp.]|nr:hypothetical protein [Acidocella sp.]